VRKSTRSCEKRVVAGSFGLDIDGGMCQARQRSQYPHSCAEINILSAFRPIIRQERTYIKSDLRRFSNYTLANRSHSTSVRRTAFQLWFGIKHKKNFSLCGIVHTSAPSQGEKRKVHTLSNYTCLVVECSLLT
jgi:hypothetical protein